jgi:hypothetical protein
MILQVYDKFLPIDQCNSWIDFYKDNKDQSYSTSTDPAFNRKGIVITDTEEFKFLQNKLNQVGIYANNSMIYYAEIVRWPVGSKQSLHYDTNGPLNVAQDYTALTSILYLNDNFIGGETYFVDGMVFTPTRGRLILYDGRYFEHGVHDVIQNDRYVVSAWHTKYK